MLLHSIHGRLLLHYRKAEKTIAPPFLPHTSILESAGEEAVACNVILKAIKRSAFEKAP